MVDPRPMTRIQWRQDHSRRVITISGPMDEKFAQHLHGATIDLGRRSLVIDLSGTALPNSAVEHIRLLRERLGRHRLSVLVRDQDAKAVGAHDIEIAATEP